MKHHDCSGPACRPSPCSGILLPRILARGRQWLRSCFTLEVEGLPACMQPPCTLISVSPGGECSWEPLPGSPLCYSISVPLICQVRDSCGCMHCGRACISFELRLTPFCPVHECWRACMLVLPCVRLICSVCAQDCCFQAQLEVAAEGYLLRWEPCALPGPKPICPDLPLYPQPCCP